MVEIRTWFPFAFTLNYCSKLNRIFIAREESEGPGEGGI